MNLKIQNQTKNQTIPQPIETDFILITDLKDFYKTIKSINKPGYYEYAYKIHSPCYGTYYPVSIGLTKYGFIQVEYNNCLIHDGENFTRAVQLYNNPELATTNGETRSQIKINLKKH